MVVRINARQDKAGIQLAAQAQNEHLLAYGGGIPGACFTGAGGKPLQPGSGIVSGIHATGAVVKIDGGNGADTDQVAQQAQGVADIFIHYEIVFSSHFVSKSW